MVSQSANDSLRQLVADEREQPVRDLTPFTCLSPVENGHGSQTETQPGLGDRDPNPGLTYPLLMVRTEPLRT